MPAVKSDRERGYIGAWMRRERLARGWKPKQVADEITKLGRHAPDPDYLRQLEARTNGRTPGRDLLEDLIAVFGSEPAPFPEEPVVEPEPSADRQGDVAAAIRELVAELRISRQEQRQSTAFLTDLLGVVARIAGGEEGLAQIADAVRAQTPANSD